MHRGFNCNIYAGGKVPPCSAFLGNSNPIIKDGKLIYNNMNRIFCFLSTSPKLASMHAGGESSAVDLQRFLPLTSTNLQISLATFIIGLYINQVQLGDIEYRQNAAVHSDKTANSFIHQTIQQSPKVEIEYTPQLSFVYSNGNAILPLISTTQEITPLNYYILFILDRLENNPGLFFGNNSFTEEDPINFALAALNIQLPFKKLK